MKILIVMPEVPYPPDNGGKNKSYNVLRSLSSVHECDLLVFSDQDQEVQKLKEVFPNVNILARCPHNSKWRKHWNRVLAILTLQAPALRSAYSAKMKKLVRDTVKETAYDLIFFDALNCIYYDQKDFHMPKVLSVSDAFSMAAERISKQQRNPIKKLYYHISYRSLKKLEKKAYPKYSAVTIVSPADFAYLRALNENTKLELIPIQVEDKYFIRGAQKRNALYFNGNFTYYGIAEGLFDFLENGYMQVHQRLPDVEFVVHARCASQKQIEAIQGYPNVTYVDYVDDFAANLSTMKVMVAPDSAGSGLKNRVLQAFATAVAVVGNSYSLEGFSYTNGVHAFCENNTQAMAERIISLFENPDVCEDVSQNAQALAQEKYSEGVVAKKWLTMIQNCIKNQGDEML